MRKHALACAAFMAAELTAGPPPLSHWSEAERLATSEFVSFTDGLLSSQLGQAVEKHFFARRGYHQMYD